MATLEFNRSLRLGMDGEDVAVLQKKLESKGHYKGPVTGFFGPLTQKAVKSFQITSRITPTGSAGVLTRMKLGDKKEVSLPVSSVELVKILGEYLKVYRRFRNP